jgi:hypothetical protein
MKTEMEQETTAWGWSAVVLLVLAVVVMLGADWRQDRRDLRRNHKDEWRMAKGAAEATADLYDLNRREKSQQRVTYALQEVETSEAMPVENAVRRWLECPADMDDDNRVGSREVEIVMEHWNWVGNHGVPPPGDVDDGTQTGTPDMVTNVSDLLYVLAVWGVCPHELESLLEQTAPGHPAPSQSPPRTYFLNTVATPNAIAAGVPTTVMRVAYVTVQPIFDEEGAIVGISDLTPPGDGPYTVFLKPDGRMIDPETLELVEFEWYPISDP